MIRATQIVGILLLASSAGVVRSNEVPAAKKGDDSGGAAAGGRRWAVVIGVNEYLDTKISSLKYCVADARLVARRLVERCGYREGDILVLTDDQPRAHMRPLSINIQNHAREWLMKPKKGDTVLVFFSGHGFLDERGRGFLATADCRKDNMALSSLRTDELRDWLQQCKATQKLLVLDCCHAGGEKGDAPDGPSSQELGLSFKLAEGLITLASCQKDELSQEWSAKGQGLFTYFLAEGLAGGADADRNGVVDSDEIYSYTLEKVRDTGRRELNVRQTPVRIIPEGVVGRFALARVSASGAPATAAAPARPASRVPFTLTVREGKNYRDLGPLVEGAEVEVFLKADVAGGDEVSLATGRTDGQGKAALELAATRGELERRSLLFRVKHSKGVTEDDALYYYSKNGWTVTVPRTEVPREVTNTIGMKLVRIEPGSFTMGSPAAHIDRLKADFPNNDHAELSDEQPAHNVRITKPFYMGRHEVTIEQFRQFVEAKGDRTTAEESEKGGRGWDEASGTFGTGRRFSWRFAGFPQSDNHPVTNVSWDDANAFCKWLSSREGERLDYRLPTEAEWEYACRAGSTGVYGEGDDKEKLALVANVADAQLRQRLRNRWFVWADDGHRFTAPVGTYPANRWGLHDMIGNVWEWCSDYYSADWYRQSFERDPTGPRWDTVGEPYRHVIRGGCWYPSGHGARPGGRAQLGGGGYGPIVGYRVAAVPK